MAPDEAVDQLARWSPLRTAALRDPQEAERLRVGAKDLEQFLQGPGWQVVQRWLASEQQKALAYLIDRPGQDRADQYALKRAHASGVLQGLKLAYDTPRAVLEISRQVSEQQQRAAEMAVQEGER